MNMKKGIHMSKDALRVVAAAGVLSVVLGLGACSMPGSGNAGASDGGSSSSSSSSGSSSYEAELKQALQSASSDFERGVLERAAKAGRISESDYREANEKYQECMAAKGDDVEFDTDQSTGLMQEHMNTDDNYDSAKANEDSMACAKGTNLQIRDLYERMVQNPSNADEIELVVGCLKRRKLVPDSFTKQDYLTEMGKPEGVVEAGHVVGRVLPVPGEPEQVEEVLLVFRQGRIVPARVGG